MSKIAPDGTSYTLTGPVGAPVVALIHGLGLCRGVFDGMLPDFEEFQVLSYDLYGHGDSGPVPSEASLTLYSDQLAGLLDHLDIAQAHVVGFSIGGMINRRFALDHPGRLASLTILNSPHNRGAELQAQVEARAKTVRGQGAMATMDDALKRWFTPEYLAAGNGPDLVRKWRGQVDPESYAQAAWVLANGVVELIAPTPQITAPTLVMTCGNDSGSTPKMSRDIAAEIPGSDCQIIPKLQHLGLMEDSKAFSGPIVKFLKGLPK